MIHRLVLPWISFFSSVAVGHPQGHLLPLGSQRDSEGQIEEIHGWTTPQQFYLQFVSASRPVVFRGVLNDSYAVQLWNDAYLKSQYGSHYVKVDVSKKENRLLNSLQMPLSTFLDRYNTSDWYLVDTILPQMAKDIQLPKCLSCGGYRQTVQDIVMWFSSGNTKSSFHFDTVENLNCQISGVKRWFFIDKEEGGLHEAIDHMESDFSGVNVDAVDLYHYPKFQNVSWWSAESHVGDCVYVPYK
jgi:lysine-specific demethylase 8